MYEFGKVKILVAGDSGVGKTAFVHLLCHDEALLSPSWTVGCNVELTVFPKNEFNAPDRKDQHFVELWDIGGSASHQNTRSVFYENLNGIILVHDLTNKKSEANLEKWLNEILITDSLEVVCHSDDALWRSSKDSSHHHSSSTQPFSISRRTFANTQAIPVLVVGTKMDQLRGHYRKSQISRNDSSYNSLEFGKSFLVFSSTESSNSFAMQHKFPEILIDCNETKSISMGSSNEKMVSYFLQQVIHSKKKFGSDASTTPASSSSSFPFQSNLSSNPSRPYNPSSGAVTYRMANF